MTRPFFPSLLWLFTLFITKAYAEYCVQGDFFFVDFQVGTFSEQIANCQARGGELAAFRGQTQLNTLSTLLLRIGGPISFWVGIEHVSQGQDVNSNPADFVFATDFVSNDITFISESQVGVAPWQAGEPNGVIGNPQTCVGFNSEGGLFDENCNIAQPAICRIPDVCVDSQEGIGISCIEEFGQVDMYAIFASGGTADQSLAGSVCSEIFFGANRLSFDTFFGFSAFQNKFSLHFPTSTMWTDIVLTEPGNAASAIYEQEGFDTDFLIFNVQPGFSPPWGVAEPIIESGVFFSPITGLGAANTLSNFDIACRIRNAGTCQNIPSQFTDFSAALPTNVTFAPTFSDGQGTNSPTFSGDFFPDGRSTCFADSEILVINAFTSFFDAESLCDNFGSNFDGVESEGEIIKLTSFLDTLQQDFGFNPEVNGVWLGFSSNGDGTTSSEFFSSAGNDVATNFISTLQEGVAPWQLGHPNGADVCVRLFQGQLETVPCTDTNNLVFCTRRQQQFCAGETFCDGNTQTRVLPFDFLTFDDAQLRCKEFGLNSAAIGVSSPEDYFALVSHITAARDIAGFSPSFWTGYRAFDSTTLPADFVHDSTLLKGVNDFVQSVDNGVFPWALGQPSSAEVCVVINDQNLLETQNCNFQFPVACTTQYAQECTLGRFCTESNVEFLYYPEGVDALSHSSNCRDLLGPSASAAFMDSFEEFIQVRDQFSFFGVPAWTNYEVDGPDASFAFDRDESSFFLEETTNFVFPWAVDEPNANEVTECLDFGEFLTSQDCGLAKPGLCRIDNSVACFEPQPDTRCLNGVTYTFIPDRVTFFEAESVCNQRGGSLVSITSPVEVALMTAFQTDNIEAAEGMWSGLFAQVSNGSPSDYQFIGNNSEGIEFVHVETGQHPWQQNQPRIFAPGFPSCALFLPGTDGSELVISFCEDSFTFVCEIPNDCKGLVVPDEWFCDPNLFGDGEVCNCRCGAFDPDCIGATGDQPECDAGVSCNAVGTCDLPVPPEWICPVESYNTLDGCDCDCGAPDPDCDSVLVPDQNNKNCDGTCLEGVCLGFDILKPTQAQCSEGDGAFFFHTPLSFEEANEVCQTFLAGVIQDDDILIELSPISSSVDIDLFFTISDKFDISSTGMHVGIVANSNGQVPVSPADFNSILPGNISFVTNAQTGEFPWGVGEPNELIAGTTCVALGADGLLFDSSCEEKRPFICRIPQLCSQGEIGVTCTGEDLALADDGAFVPYSVIGEVCQLGLVSVSSEESLAAFNRILSQDESTNGLWAGIDAIELGSQGDPANFRFFDQNQDGLEFITNRVQGEFPWDVNEPNSIGLNQSEDCVIVDKASGLLQDVSCDSVFPPLCVVLLDFCNGVADNGGTGAPTPSPVVNPTVSPTTSPTNSPTESPTKRISTCSRRTFGITNPTKFF